MNIFYDKSIYILFKSKISGYVVIFFYIVYIYDWVMLEFIMIVEVNVL